MKLPKELLVYVHDNGRGDTWLQPVESQDEIDIESGKKTEVGIYNLIGKRVAVRKTELVKK